MKLRYTSHLLGYLLLCILLLSGVQTQAQTVVINTGTPGTPQYNAGPIYRSSATSAYDASRYVYLYTQDELANVGITTGAIIQSVGWIKANDATTTSSGATFRIYMKNSTTATYNQASATWTNLSAGMEMVYENTNFAVPATMDPEYIVFNFQTPFTYTGGSIEIATEWDCNAISGNASTGTFNWMWSTVVDRIYGIGETTLANAGTLSSTSNSISDINDRRPYIQITFTPGGPCTNPPTPGTVTASPANVCMGQIFQLSYSGGSNGSGQTLQWQSSTDGVTWTDIPGATGYTYTGTQTVTHFYRMLVTCGTSVPSNAVEVQTPIGVQGVFTINRLQPTGGTNFASFNDAYDFIKCGIIGPVVFNVVSGSGPYNEQLIMNEIPGAGPTATVTFNGNYETLNFISTNTNERAVIKLNGTDYVTINDLIINSLGTSTSEYGFGIQLMNDANNNIINGCVINLNTTSISTNYAGIVLGGTATSAVGTSDNNVCDDNFIVNNVVNGGYYGITVVGSGNQHNTNNLVTANVVNDFYSYGIYVLGSSNLQVEMNTIQRPTRTTVTTFYGIYFTNTSVQASVTKNRILEPFSAVPTNTSAMYGIYTTSCNAPAGMENIFSNNLIYRFHGSGSAYGIYTTSSNNAHFLHNTIVLDGNQLSGSSSTITRGFYQLTQSNGLVLKNNIFDISRGGSGPKYMVYLGTTTTAITIDRNVYYFGPSVSNFNIGYKSSDFNTLTNWQTQGYDANSLTENPNYLDAPSGNYMPQSPLIDNMGEPVGIFQDINNAMRSTTTPDPGAYEYTAPPCIFPPVGGTATVSESIVCENTLVRLGVVGQSAGSGQTYVWQSSLDNGTTWTDITGAVLNPNHQVTATVTMLYRVVSTCNGNSTPSTPILLTVRPSLPAGTYTINPDLPASSTNFTSINAAIQAMNCGISGPVVFNVNPTPAATGGVYNEQLIIPQILNTSATNTITFNGFGALVRFSNATNDQRAVVKLNGADYVTFNQFIFDGSQETASYGFVVQLINDADNNTFNNNTFIGNTSSTSTAFATVVLNSSSTSATTTGNADCDNNIFENNTIIGGYYAVSVVGSATNPIYNNMFIGNTLEDFYNYGFYINGTTGTLIENNNISRPNRTSNSTFYGIYTTGVSTSLNITRNTIHNPFGGVAGGGSSTVYGIYNTGTDGSMGAENNITNNLMFNFNTSSAIYAIYSTSSDYCRYQHNTIAIVNHTPGSTGLTRAFYQTTSAVGMEFKNNLIYLDRISSGVAHAVYLGTTSTNIVMNNNNYYIAPGGDRHVGYYNNNQTTLTAWQNTSGQDPNSYDFDPQFASIIMNNYVPSFGALDDKGTPLSYVPIDITGQPRSTTTPDIGAYEFFVPPCTVPPTAGTATVTPDSGICMGVIVTLDLNGNSIGSGQTYQWQSAPSATGPWTNISGELHNPIYQWEVGVDTFFRAVVVCNGNTEYSNVVMVDLNPVFLGGVYTIDPAGGDFLDFTSAVAALDCGITDDVIFLVAPGVYNEQVRMRYIPGTNDNTRVTFMSANGDPTSVTLQWSSTSTASNYVLMMDSTKYVTYRDMTIKQLSTSNGRAVVFANSAGYDSLYNLIITVPSVNSTSDAYSAVYGTDLRGKNIVVKNNTITGGSNGVRLEGISATLPVHDIVIDSNRIQGFYNYGIYNDFTAYVKVRGNEVTISSNGASPIFGIYGTNSDSAYDYSYNKVSISNVSNTAYGIYLTNSDTRGGDFRSRMHANKVTAITNITGGLYGFYHNNSVNSVVMNNVVSVRTTSTTCYGMYFTGGSANRIWNNTVQNNTIGTGTSNIAFYISQSSGGSGMSNVRNNIFSHVGNGIAYHMANTTYTYSDYNFLYTTGNAIIRAGSTNYTTLNSFINSTYWDVNSIVYRPAFTNNTDLEPKLDDPDVWAMHGRGVQISENSYDYYDQPRPTTLTSGVPDMGAFEFVPTALPTELFATPATPAPGITQTFMYGTDTVMKVTYAPGSTVPTNLSLRRYSGVIPPNLAPGQASTYYYTEAIVTGPQPSSVDVKHFFIDPWQGFISSQSYIRLGRTDVANVWQVNAASTVDEMANVMMDNQLDFMDKFTGLTDGTIPPPQVGLANPDSSNRGTKFWVGYGHHQNFGSGNSQDMVLYFSAEEDARVTVRINGTGYVREYAVPGGNVIVSQIIPKTGIFDARLMEDGKSERGISIESDVPIVAYAHIYASTTSEAAMLLPVGTYGYEYTALTTKQNYASDTYSWFYVIADHDNTLLEITPSSPTLSGYPGGVPFTVQLNKGEVYQVLGAIISGSDGYDLTGSTVKSITNSDGRCLPFAMFSGSSRTNIGCGNSNPAASGDNLLEQNFPYSAWGRKYLVAPTSNSSAANSFHTNIYRVAVKDPTTNVYVNGVLQTTLINNFYYQFESNTPDVITADKPIVVAQIMASSTYCPNTSGGGDPALVYVSPVEQGIKRVGLYRNTVSAITTQYLTLILPTAAIPSLRIDGSNAFDHTYAHNEPGYSVVVKRWSPATNAQVIVECDSAFTAITYGLGSVESYAYNAGTLVRNLNGTPTISNTLATSNNVDYTCVDAPFNISVRLNVKPEVLTWGLSNISVISPNIDVVETNPVAVDSVVINGQTYYDYILTGDYTISVAGTYNIPIYVEHPDVEGCGNRLEITLNVVVKPAPLAEFDLNFGGCFSETAIFEGVQVSSNGSNVSTWSWNFGDNTTSTVQNPSHTWSAPGSYPVSLSILTEDGCLGDSTVMVEVFDKPDVNVVQDNITVCNNESVTFEIQNPITGVTYQWYNTATGGTPIATGTTFTIPNVVGTMEYWVEAVSSACVSDQRVQVTAIETAALPAPVVSVQSVGADFVTFEWTAVPGAIGYEVSINNGATWMTPSSGSTGLTHTVSGLQPMESVTLVARAITGNSCNALISDPVTGETIGDDLYIPNAFTPNGDGINDVLQVYGRSVDRVRFIVFNQWGEKIHESTNPSNVWDGKHRGKLQPSGVYIYVCEIVLRNGTKMTKKGSINLIR